MMFGEQDVLVYQEAVLASRSQRLGCCASPLNFVQPFQTHSGYYLRLLYGQNNRSSAPRLLTTSSGSDVPPPMAPPPARRKPDTTCLKRSRINAGYELSHDLAERQVACLERRYGGRRARRAAIIIQRAYRRYALDKKFRAITLSAKSDRRLSRRFEVPAAWRQPPPPVRHAAMSRQTSGTSGHSSGLNGSLENDSDLSDREYQSYGFLNDSTYLSEYYTPPSSAGLGGRGMNGLGAPTGIYMGDHQRVAAPGGGGGGRRRQRGPPPEPPHRTTSVSCSAMPRPLDAASSSSESSLASAGPVSTSSPVMRRRSQRSSSSHSSGGHRTLPRTQSDSAPPPSDQVDRVPRLGDPRPAPAAAVSYSSCKVPEIVRKRQYRVGLNLFNTKPERGVAYLMARGFLDETPQGVARFLITRKGLSKQRIGEYLGDLQSPFCAAVLEAFAQELDFYNMQLDAALRKFQAYFRLPGEAQKIERLMEVFGQRYTQCNHEFVSSLKTPDTVFVLAFAIIMLNTDLFTPNIKPERKMKLEDFIKNLRNIDDGADVDPHILAGIYERVRAQEFRAGADHVTPVLKVEQTTIGKKPQPLALPHRRLVCYCRLYEVPDVSKRDRPGVHQREVFLFNDLMLVTKIFSKKKNAMTYSCRQSIPLAGLSVSAFDLPHYPFGIRLSQRVDGKVLLTFNARNEHDRTKFCEDLRESILEMDEMEALRIDAGLERQKAAAAATRAGRPTDNRDSGVADVEDGSDGSAKSASSGGVGLKRAALSNSLLDVSEARPQRRGSVGSLDSGMSVSFQSSSTASAQTGSPPTQPAGQRAQRRPQRRH
ncbi:IQ motif and SEC7 domain-containing protein 1-like isoform X1 [Amphibalanus amphitrite]|uniref:IQ motif and SEC7 domain-containing protein 1-like isoform X1 n=1 Tax=Amphibalanus amphitrite TaxID=1232801 RepID=UPI001C91CEBD|nr:IQ motif and SEC7 domain-containing protein 1-like isoform X1 [Amphibalanus amphitrite]